MNVKVKQVQVGKYFNIGGDKFTLIGGPCAIESEEMSLQVAARLNTICKKMDINYVFKSSFDKANRSSINSPRGVGLDEGIRILKKVKQEIGVPIITDVHESWQCEIVGEVADILQIPAFLSRQTDLILSAAKTGKVVNIKKGQFMAPWDMRNVVNKMKEAGNENILLCERGSCFGYNNLVVDMTGLMEMRALGYPVIFDATHSVQKPSGNGNSSGGNRKFVYPLMRAALAVGIDAVFAEIHPDPDKAFSDASNQLYLDDIEVMLENANKIYRLSKEWI